MHITEYMSCAFLILNDRLHENIRLFDTTSMPRRTDGFTEFNVYGYFCSNLKMKT